MYFVISFLVFASVAANRCTDKYGYLLPSATVCEDADPSCGEFFKVKTKIFPAARDPLCDEEDLKEYVMVCAKTCGLCCERPDIKDSCQDRTHGCVADQCGHPRWTDMTEDCPKTCNTCPTTTIAPITTPNPDCKEEPECTDLKDKCAIDSIKNMCPVSCGACPTTTAAPTTTPAPLRCTDSNGNLLPSALLCEDEVDDCKNYFPTDVGAKPASRDNSCNAFLMTTLAMKCAKTCGLCCERPDIVATCQDTLAECPERQDLCAQDNTKVFWAKKCPKTCDSCPTPPTTTTSAPTTIAKEVPAACQDQNFCAGIEDECAIETVQELCPVKCGLCPTTTPASTTAPPTTSPAPTTTPAPVRCTDVRGSLLPSAQICEDKIDACQKIFPTEATKSPAGRDPNCDHEKYSNLAMECARTCAICCELPEIRDSCQDALAECPEKPEFCSDVVQKDLWLKHCPKTCGTCPTDAPTTVAPTSASDPSTTPALTEAPSTTPTLEATTSPTSPAIPTTIPEATVAPTVPPTVFVCLDKSRICRKNFHNCRVSTYAAWMKLNCPRTCGLCPGARVTPAPPAKPICFDQSSNCAGWKRNGFCDNTYYSYGHRYNSCGRTCGFC
ncbi:hypothetical protein QR680_010272 [Steinernema hermaphroditum]|uniref:ShKT domain-containing protein n=1 Tax=Steinernema hermaphroditum TaxID=289476 RepID=A0AA39MB97_9BILA|nr:hypothetical protein QR680_010272 [Steinernema hermaphroditum]